NLFDNPVYSPPSTTGFWLEDMPPQKKYYKVIDGTRYLVTEIKTALFATGPGEFTIGQARLEASVEDINRSFSNNPFDDPFSMFKRGKPVTLTTDPIKVEIETLPEQNKPLGFKGDVGNFDIFVSADKNMVEENQPVSLKIKIKGKGNIKTVSSPVIPDIPDAKFYESGSSENISKDNYIVQGEKVFEKVIIPKKEGNIAVGQIEYDYFDPVLKDYVRKKLDPVTISVSKSKEDPAEKTISIPGVAKEDVELLKRDIAYIKMISSNFGPRNNFLYKNKVFLLINILPLFILVFLYLYELRRARLRTDVGYARSLRAKSSAAKRLKAARKIMDKNTVKEFYTEIYKAVIEYIADKLNIPHPSITKDLLEAKLLEIKTGREVTEKVKALFDACDMARFASAGFTKDDMHKTLKEAEDIIAGLERRI
ncbi:MAG: BatD family protein, partial [Candidatus Omnitrophota bacterium]|nr:BatD family protein [Candidatus Omnitrophota bacterium]